MVVGLQISMNLVILGIYGVLVHVQIKPLSRVGDFVGHMHC